MRVGEPLADLHHHVDAAIHRGRRIPGNDVRKALTTEQLHDDVGAPVVLAEVENRDDVPMQELPGRASLPVKALAGIVGRFEISSASILIATDRPSAASRPR